MLRSKVKGQGSLPVLFSWWPLPVLFSWWSFISIFREYSREGEVILISFSPQNHQAYDVIKIDFFHCLFNYLFIYLFFIYLFIYFVEIKWLHKVGALVPRFTTRNFSQRFQRYEGVKPLRQEGQRTIRARDSLPRRWILCHNWWKSS